MTIARQTPASPPHQFASTEEAVREILGLLRANRRFLVCGHMRPDGDCIGSAAALYHFLKNQGKEVRLFLGGPILETFEGIVAAMGARESEFPAHYPADATLCVDCGGTNRIADDFRPRGLVVNIDHHHGNTRFGNLNWVNADFAAVGEMVFLLIDAAGPGAWTPEIASCVYLAVVTDTGAFRYANTTARSFRIAARLVEEGADPGAIAVRVWGNRKIESCLIAAAVWNSLRFELDGKLVWSEITQEVFIENGGEANEPDNLVSELIGINGTAAAMLLRETSEGVRASFRGRPQVDVSAIAEELGGGGHRAAAGVELKGVPYAQARERIVQTTIRRIREQLGLS